MKTESEGVTETEIETEKEIQVFLLKEYVGDYIEIAQRELEEHGIIVRVMESESTEYEKGRIIEQSLSQNTEMHANMEITFLVSSGKIEEDITNDEEIERPSYEDNNTISENADNTVEEPVQQIPEEPVVQEPVVIPLGTYGESNVLSGDSISVVRNSVLSNCSGNIDAEKENLAKYMSANGCSNASTTYSSLTNGGNVNWNAKVCTVQLESDTNEQLEDACMSVVSKIGTVSGSVGIGISSFQNEQVGYRIVVVVVY